MSWAFTFCPKPTCSDLPGPIGPATSRYRSVVCQTRQPHIHLWSEMRKKSARMWGNILEFVFPEIECTPRHARHACAWYTRDTYDTRTSPNGPDW